MNQETESNLVRHAKFELRHKLGKDDYDGAIADSVLQLIELFATHEHSGFSAGFAISTFERLARFEPLGPLTGEDDEWNEVGIDDGAKVFQNRRCSHVFKQEDRFDGQAYDTEGRIFREPSGACYTNHDSFVPITFPYTPKREYVDVPARDAEDA